MNDRPYFRSLFLICVIGLVSLAAMSCQRISAYAIFPEKMAEKKAAAEAAAQAPTPTPTPLPPFFPGRPAGSAQ